MLSLWDWGESVHGGTTREWMDFMKDEMETIRANQVWGLMDLHAEYTVIGNKCILKIKQKANRSIERYMACLMANAYTQWEGVDYKKTFSPMVMFASIHTILALVARMNLEFIQMDIKIVFLHWELDEVIFMDQTEDFLSKVTSAKFVSSGNPLIDWNNHLDNGIFNFIEPYYNLGWRWLKRTIVSVLRNQMKSSPSWRYKSMIYWWLQWSRDDRRHQGLAEIELRYEGHG